MSEPRILGDAALSACGRYRYELRRWWSLPPASKFAVFVMLNPSTADAYEDDPTIRKCIGFAKRWGMSGIAVVNLFAWRSTRPSGLLAAVDPIGPENDGWIRKAVGDPFASIIAAWGQHGARFPDRVREVCDLIRRPMRCLGMTGGGQPLHPLMQPYRLIPQPWGRQGEAA